MSSTRKTSENYGSANKLPGVADAAAAGAADAAGADAAGEAAADAAGVARPGDVAAGVSREHVPTALTDAGRHGRPSRDRPFLFTCGTPACERYL